MDTKEFKEKLVNEISKCNKVKGIGQTGDIHAPLIPGKSDIDLFVICAIVPSKEERLKVYAGLEGSYSALTMEVCNGGLWGFGDILISNGIEVMPMYFTVEEMEHYLDDTLQGKNLNKDGRFYPIGRLASIENIHILYEEKEAWSRLRDKVKEYPETLFKRWYLNEISCVLDEEDLCRAILRKEVLFYHQVLEEALDHLLQALYAVNHCYFPSRKRTQNAVEAFQIKPQDCYERLLQIVTNAASSETIEASVNDLKTLTAEIAWSGSLSFNKENTKK